MAKKKTKAAKSKAKTEPKPKGPTPLTTRDPNKPTPTEVLVKSGTAEGVRNKLAEIAEKGREVDALQLVVDEAAIALTAARKNHQKAGRELTAIIRGEPQGDLPFDGDAGDDENGGS